MRCAGGQLTEAVRRRPYAIVLFDEVEKAHADVFNVLLQVLDDGRVTDSQGRTVSFKNTVIIMTSNLGSASILAEDADGARASVMRAVHGHFRPEFINRVDEFIIFDALKREQIRFIVRLQGKRVADRLADKKMSLQLLDSGACLAMHAHGGANCVALLRGWLDLSPRAVEQAMYQRAAVCRRLMEVGDMAGVYTALSACFTDSIPGFMTPRLSLHSQLEHVCMSHTDCPAAAVDFLADRGFDPVFGARPVKRAVQRNLETILAKAILHGDFQEEDTIVVDADEHGLKLSKGAPGARSDSSLPGAAGVPVSV